MRLIDADALMAQFDIWDDCDELFVQSIRTEIEHAPTIEPERKTGRWIDGSIPTYAACSECGYQERYAYENNYCPN